MTSFYPGVTAVDLVPGNPAAVNDLAAELSSLARGLGDAAAELQRIDAGSWRGQAGDAFRHVIGQQPGRYADAAAAFGLAAGALGTYADSLQTAQLAASRAIGHYESAQRATGTWQQGRAAAKAAGKAPPPGGDPGESGRAEAESILRGVHGDLDAAAARLKANLSDAERAAPKRPGLFSRAVHGVEHLASDFVHFEGKILDVFAKGIEDTALVAAAAGEGLAQVVTDPKGWWASAPPWEQHFLSGVWDGTEGLVTGVVSLGVLAFKLSPMNMMVDPEGWAKSEVGLTVGIGHTVYRAFDDPRGFFGDLVNVHDWETDPWHAAGTLVPTLVIGVATAGVGAAADASLETAGAAVDAEGTSLAETEVAVVHAQHLAELDHALRVYGWASDGDAVLQAGQGKPGDAGVEIVAGHATDAVAGRLMK